MRPIKSRVWSKNYSRVTFKYKIVIAGNHAQYLSFLETVLPIENRKLFIEAIGQEHLLGIEADAIFQVGTYWERKDLAEIMEVATMSIR